MDEKQRKRLEAFIDRFQIAPGSKVDPATDFDGFPVVDKRKRQELAAIKKALEAQAPKGAVPDPFEARHADRRS